MQDPDLFLWFHLSPVAQMAQGKDAVIVKKSVSAYARLFKPSPFVPDKGIQNVVKDLTRARPEFKEYLGWPEPFRENGPLKRALREK